MMHNEAYTDDQPSSGRPCDPSGRAYRAKGPTLGKGKACESCRTRRTVSLPLYLASPVKNVDIKLGFPQRCNGVRPSCSNCTQADRECVYLDKPRPPASAAALSAKLAGLEERYRMLSEMEAARTGQEGGRIVVTGNAFFHIILALSPQRRRRSSPSRGI